jgi:MerR family transcriptional regulator/heat shock protein HspR
LQTPARTSGGTRRYSDDDLVRLARIAQLMDDGVNVPGIQRILALESENADLASRLEGPESGAAGG